MKTPHNHEEKLVAIEATINVTSNGGMRIANVDPTFRMSSKERNEYAKKIVKAVNMHDELMKVVKEFNDYLKPEGVHNSLGGNQLRIYRRLRSLIAEDEKE